MREAILWVAEALPKKSAAKFLPIFNHIHIGGGFVVASNGRITMAHPVAESFEANPVGQSLVDAIKICSKDKIAISQIANGNLLIRQGSFNVKIPSSGEVYPTSPSGGLFAQLTIPVRKAMSEIRKFVSEDNLRPIFRSIYFCGEKLQAAGNVSIAEYWHGTHTNFNFAIPVEAVDAVLSVKEEPYDIEISQNWVRFWYSNGAWIHTPFMEDKFPNLDHVFAGDWTGWFNVVPPTLWEALDRLKPFVDETGWLSIDNGSVDTGAANDAVPGLFGSARYVHKYIAMLRDSATHANFGTPLRWIGGNVRGVVYGKGL